MPDPVQPGVAVVKKNEKLDDIARRFGRTVDEIIAFNPQFDPDSKNKRVDDWALERTRRANGEIGLNANAIQQGDLIRVAELEDSYFVTEAGLVGDVFAPELVKSENNRLMALRRYADGCGEGNVPDGMVTAEEARCFMQWTQGYLASQGKAGPETAALDSYEQKELIALGAPAVASNVNNGYGAQTQEVFKLAPQSFEIQNWPNFTSNNIHSSLANQVYVTSLIPVALNASPDFAKELMQNFDKSTSAAVKVFTPNANLLKLTGDADTNAKWLKQFKIHNWVAGKTELSVGRTYVGESGGLTRTATITSAIGYQPEAVLDINAKKFDFRTFVTNNNAAQIQYQITTNPDRLTRILNGEIKAPSPYDLSTMQPGDVVTITSGAYSSWEFEQRALFNPAAGLTKKELPGGRILIPETGEERGAQDGLGGGLRAGLDIKFDNATFNGDNRLVVKMLPDNHVQVFHGSSKQDFDAQGAGFIWNPDVSNASRTLQNGSQGAFFRLMPQARQVEVNNTFHFVELDLNDNQPGGGKALFQRILNTGEVPTAQSLQPIRGVIQHGTLDYHEAQKHFTLQATFYNEKPRLLGRETKPTNLPRHEPPKAEPLGKIDLGEKIGKVTVFSTNDWASILGTNSTQVLEQNNIDIMSTVSTDRRIDVRHVYPKLKSTSSSTNHDDAVNPETVLGSGSQKTTLQYTRMGGVRLTEAGEVHSGTGAKHTWPMLISQHRGDKAAVERALTAMIADEADGKAPLFEDFVVTGRDEKGDVVEYRGAEALAYLKSRKDRSNDYLWGALDGRDTVPIRILTVADKARGNEMKIADFTNQYISDYKAANSTEGQNFLEKVVSSYGEQAIVRGQVTATMLGSEYLNIQDGGLNKISLERAGTGHEIRQLLTGFDLGEWIGNVQDYRAGKGKRINGAETDPYYPVRIVIDVPY